jgi:hypothetical protein
MTAERIILKSKRECSRRTKRMNLEQVNQLQSDKRKTRDTHRA